MNIIEKRAFKVNVKESCKCYACRDSEFSYNNSSVLIEDESPLIFRFLGRDLTK